MAEADREEVQELTDRITELRARLDAGKLKFAEHLVEDFRRSFEAIRLQPNGLVDPSTVDGRIRSAGLMVRFMKDREAAKKEISIARIQEVYFTRLFAEFGWLYEHMVEKRVTPAQVADRASKDLALVKQVHDVLPAIAKDLREFWEAVGEAGAYHLQDSPHLKASFAGDLFPGHSRNAVSIAGLYVDTIVLPCPVLRVAPLLHSTMPESDLVAMLLKHVLTAMTYRDVALAEVDPPIAVVLPNRNDLDVGARSSVADRAKPFILSHASYLFGRKFESVEDLGAFCGHLVTVDQAMAELKGADRLLFATEWEESGARAQLTRAMRGEFPQPRGMDPNVAGFHVLGTCIGRMPQAFAAQENAFETGATPYINAETSWRYYTWLLEYEAAGASPGEQSESLHVTRALIAERNNNLKWLGNVPPATVVEIRKACLAEELRSLLGHGVSELIQSNPTNFFRTADQVVDNLDRAFRAHEKALLEARNNKLRLYGLDVPACLVTGAIGVAAALTSNVGLGVAAGILGASGLPNLKDIKSRYGQIVDADAKRRSSPTGLLFQHVKGR